MLIELLTFKIRGLETPLGEGQGPVGGGAVGLFAQVSFFSQCWKWPMFFSHWHVFPADEQGDGCQRVENQPIPSSPSHETLGDFTWSCGVG